MTEADHLKQYGPIIIETTRLSDTTNALSMSNDTTLYGCTWPKCNYVVETRESVPRHYKTHSGQAAQKRRADRRPRSAVVVNEVLESALALLDMVQDLVDKLDAFDAEFADMRKQIAENAIITEDLRQQVETNRIKAERYDLIMQMTKEATIDDAS